MIKNNLRTIRQNQNISAEQLANKIFVSKQTIYNIENEKMLPNIGICIRLAECLNVTVEDLFYSS